MIKQVFFLICLFTVICCKPKVPDNEGSTGEAKVEYALVIHGGAGVIKKENFTPEKLAEYKAALNLALDKGDQILAKGGSALDAVEATIITMENSPLFNSGKGAVFTNAGTNSLDASIMSGKDRDAGAVGGVSVVKNPISAARAVMEKSNHVMLSGKGADIFAKEVGLEIVDPKYFHTERAWKSLQRALDREKQALEKTKAEKYGTVGCVALDKNGNIAAGTSTGGMTNKKWDRIGDSPIIGAGTYADNMSCGVSATGHGEYFIRNTVARDIAAMMEYKGTSLEESAKYIIYEVLVKAGGDGGIVALDAKGNISIEFNTPGMYRGYIKPGERVVKIFK